MSLVCPSIAIHRTCQFWAHSEPVNVPKTIERVSRQMWSACCNSIPLFGTSDEECCPKVLSFFMTMLVSILQPQQRGSWSDFDAKCLITDHHPPRTWFSVIFISFLIWKGRRRTTFWHNELQTSVENWLKTQAAGFYDEGIGKLVPPHEKCLRRSVDYVEK